MPENLNCYMYTIPMSPMQRGRVEKQLGKRTRHNGKVMPYADLVAMLVAQGYRPHVREHRTSTGGTVTKYALMENCEGYMLPSKTLYQFALYLVEQGAVTEKAQQALYDQEAAHVAELQRLADEEKERLLEEQREAREAYAAHKDWMAAQSAKYADDPRNETIHSITEKMYGWRNPDYAAKLLVRIDHLYENHPMIIRSLCELLEPHNKASREAFQVLTGMKLPKGVKATRAFVRALSGAGRAAG